MVGRNHHHSGNRHRLGARRMTMCTAAGGMSMVVRRRVRRTGIGDAMGIGSGSPVEKGRVVGIAALGHRWSRVCSARACSGLLANFALRLSDLDLVQDAISRVGGDALDLPLEAKLAVDKGDVVELVESEGDRERGMSGEEMGQVSAEATGVVGRGDGVCVLVGWSGAGRTWR